LSDRGPHRTPTTPNPDEPKRIDVETVDGGSVNVDTDRWVVPLPPTHDGDQLNQDAYRQLEVRPA
jgi:hypothetical protein